MNLNPTLDLVFDKDADPAMGAAVDVMVKVIGGVQVQVHVKVKVKVKVKVQ